MLSLFSNLPPESADKHILKAREEEEIPPNKRLKTETAAPAPAQVKQTLLAGQDPVATALIKITAHISSSKKFTKASELLRQLILEHKIGEEHTKLVFEVSPSRIAISAETYLKDGCFEPVVVINRCLHNRHSKLHFMIQAALRTLKCGASILNSSHWLARQLM